MTEPAAPVVAPAPPVAAAPVAPAVAAGPERFAIPLDGPTRGPATATIEIVEFSDFECPFCGRVVPTLERLLREYPTAVRLHYRHNPLNFHSHAALAAEAAVAAESQGRFWEMHDRLFAHQGQLTRADLDDHAQAVGLDLVKFRVALDGRAGRARVDADLALASRFGVLGTPVFFVNGIVVQGAQPYDVFKRFVDDDLARVRDLLAQGTPRDRLRDTLMAGAKESRPNPTPNTAPPGPSAEVYRIAPKDAPRRGGPTPKVTIIEFTDFQCPYCQRVEATLGTLLRDYGDDVAVVFKHNPLPFHERAMPAALAAEAARQQGKFWQMHDKLFASQDALDDESLEGYARELGLDLGRFRKAVRGAKVKARVTADIDEAARFGARGTPNFFINGRSFRGAQPIEAFKAAVDRAIVAADAKLQAGTPRAKLYAALTANGVAKAPPPVPAPGMPDPKTRMLVPIDGAPTRGQADALVTIVEWSDFQCPFCKRVQPTLERVFARWKGDVRLVWRDLPLPFHQDARPAARAARAAGAQGKFWEMHDRLFGDPDHLDAETFERHARDLGMDVEQFKAALLSDDIDAAIARDIEAGETIGARGTPAFFINGKFLSGAQPFEIFEALIAAELRAARALVTKGTPRMKVYDALMRGATAKVEPAKADTEIHQDPEKDKTVYKVVLGDAPSRGPASAALVLVEYGDFQCPFCRRMESTLTFLQNKYPDDLRVVWKNFPLAFHADAALAAEAAMAANAQRKFWEMHEKLIADGAALDRASLESYAAELGLDMVRFRDDLDTHRYQSRIDADTAEGQQIGVNGTPTVFLNGRRIPGAYPLPTFEAIAAAELRRPRPRPPRDDQK